MNYYYLEIINNDNEFLKPINGVSIRNIEEVQKYYGKIEPLNFIINSINVPILDYPTLYRD